MEIRACKHKTSELFTLVIQCQNKGERLDAIEPLRLYLNAALDDKVAQWLLTATLTADRRVTDGRKAP